MSDATSLPPADRRNAGGRPRVGPIRSLLRWLALGTVVLAGLEVLLLVPGQSPNGSRLIIAASLALLAAVLAMIFGLSRVVARAEAASRMREQVLDALQAGIVLFDAAGRIVFTNREFRGAYAGLGAAALPGATYEQLLRAVAASNMATEAADDRDGWIARRLADFGRTQQPLMRRMPGGGWRRIVEQRLPDGAVLAHVADVSDMVAKEEALEAARREVTRSRQLLEDAIDAMPAGFELYDADDRLVMVNRMNLQMYPQLADLAGKRPTFEEVVRTNAARGGLPMLRTPEQIDAWVERRTRERRQPAEPFVQHRIGEDRWIRTYERRMRDGSLVAIRLDVSELMQREGQLTELNAQLARLNAELSVLSQTDPLTGLANRRAFDQRLAEEVSRLSRHGMPLALLLVDIDHFKAFNDHYGHPAGDDCLRRVAMRLRECAGRPTDLVARLGGEEFALVLPHASADTALGVARHCVQAVDDAAIEHAASPLADHVTISVGVAQLGAGVAGAAALVASADAALYSAKACGRHRAMQAAPA